MSDYPGTKKNFTALIDGTTFMEAVNGNVVYDETEALQTFVGDIGTGLSQADATDLLNFMRKARQSFRLSYDDADTIEASVGEVMCANVTASQRVPRANTSATSITFSDLDTGARAQSTTYYVYAIADATATTVTFLISESPTAPTGATRYVLIGKFSTNATGSGEIVEGSVVSLVGEVVVQTKYVEERDVATGTTILPSDSAPQNDEGDEYMAYEDFVPTDEDNKIKIDVVAHLTNTGGGNMCAALFQDAIADSIGVGYSRMNSGQGGDTQNIKFTVYMTAGTTDAIDFAMRGGSDLAGTTTFNGSAGSGLYGGKIVSSIMITEYRKVYL